MAEAPQNSSVNDFGFIGKLLYEADGFVISLDKTETVLLVKARGT